MSSNQDDSAPPTQRRWQDRVRPSGASREELLRQAANAFGRGFDAAGRRLAERADFAPSSFAEREEERGKNNARNTGPDPL